MRILSIETSCDETGIAIVDVSETQITVLSNKLSSQASIHAQFGGVFPSVAKREHARMLTPLLADALFEAHCVTSARGRPSSDTIAQMKSILEREQELFVHLSMLSLDIGKPPIDCIAVTYGPGLEPALWVGVNFARALSALWNIPIVAVNHMEGHIAAATYHVSNNTCLVLNPQHPILALLVSGGHTELVLSDEPLRYAIIGQTRDDAAGECFDKCARMLGFAYPGGPEISKAASIARESQIALDERLPRPMLHSQNLDFSFSGLKTAVLTYTKKHETLSTEKKNALAREVEEAIVETLIAKLRAAVEQTGAMTVIISGGVAANKYLRGSAERMIASTYPDVALMITPPSLSTDNALMIALAAIPYAQKEQFTPIDALKARGNVRLGDSVA